MVCSRCGKQLEDGCTFCTECGNKVSQTKTQSLFNALTNNKTVEEIKKYIDRFGDLKINQYLSAVAIFSMIAVRIFGFVIMTAIVTIMNIVLVYYHYRKNSKADMKMILWSIAVLVIGILISI